MAGFEIHDMRAGYGEGDVLKGLAFSVSSGEAVGIIGPNGCGKTTLLRVLAGLLPYKGSVLLDGKEVSKYKRPEMAKKLAFMTQSASVYFPYTIYDTVMMGRHPHIKSRAGPLSSPSLEDTSFVEACLRSVDLYDIRQKEITQLSGGQLQRVFLARTLAQDPEIILLDEPTNHLDLKYQIELISFLNDFSKNKNRTVIGVFHDINMAMRLSQNVILLKNGWIERHSDIQRIIAEGILNSVYGMDINGLMIDMLSKWKPVND